jgi:hypothetical protein
VIGATTIEPRRTASSARNLVVLKLALLAAIALAARILWLTQHGEKWDTPPLMQLLILGELPLMTATVLVTRNQSRDGIVRGAGVAFGAALAYLILAPLLYGYAVLTIWDTGQSFTNLLALKGLIPVSALGAICLLVPAFRERGRSRKAFFISAAGTIGYALLAFPLILLLSVRGSGALNERNAYERPGRPLPGSTAIGPTVQVMAIAGCLLRHQFLHPQDGFPSSLTNIRTDWNCNPEIANAGISPGYWLFYSPARGLFTRRIADFRIQDLPAERDTTQWGPIVTDGRGGILGFEKLSGTAAWRKKAYGSDSPFQTVDRGDSPAQSVYVVRTNHADALPSLEGVPNAEERTWSTCGEIQVPTTRLIRMGGGPACYSIRYFLPPVGRPQDFAISAQCMTYGDGCIRSYFLDYDGSVHATSYPRPATAQDSALLPCEATIPCHDPVWTDSELPSGWVFFKANVYYTIQAQNWW